MRGNGSAAMGRLANIVIVVAGVLFSWPVEAGQPAEDSAGPEAAEALLTRYCVACHNDVRAEQGTVPVSFSQLDPEDLTPHTAVWEQVVRKLRLGMMPPAGRPRPDDEAHSRFLVWLETELERAAAQGVYLTDEWERESSFLVQTIDATQLLLFVDTDL